MAENKQNNSHPNDGKAHTPRSADDWEILFEDPENGLIAMIAQAQSVDALERSTGLASTKLLLHEDESVRLEDYQQKLVAIVAPGDEADDVAQARVEVITLLRQLKEESKRAAEGDRATPQKPKPGERQRKSSGPKKRTPLSQGLQFAQVNKIGIIVLSALALLAIVVLAFYLRSPEMPAREHRAAAAMLLAYGESVRPDASWQIEASRLTGDDKFELVFQLTSEQQLLVIRSFSAMRIAKFAAGFCPSSGPLLDKVAAYKRPIQITLKQGGKILTSASCPM